MGPRARRIRIRLPTCLRRRAAPCDLAPFSSHPSRESDYPPVAGCAGTLVSRRREWAHFARADKWAAPLPQSRNRRQPMDREAGKAAPCSHGGSVPRSAEALPGSIGIQALVSRITRGFREQRRQRCPKSIDRKIAGRNGTRHRARLPGTSVLSISCVADWPVVIPSSRVLPPLSGICRASAPRDQRLPPPLGRIS